MNKIDSIKRIKNHINYTFMYHDCIAKQILLQNKINCPFKCDCFIIFNAILCLYINKLLSINN